jgi:uncharacterized membrane-anchored protein
MRRFGLLLLLLLIGVAWSTLAEAKNYKQMFGTDPDVDPEYRTVLEALDFKQGVVPLPAAHARLNTGTDFYYLDPADTAKVLTSLWGNPPAGTVRTLGMIFPGTSRPEGADSWGTIIEYSDDGYVSDDEAENTDFSSVLADLQQSTQAGNEERKKAGYQPITLVGWASPPFYDKATHSLHWARDLVFGSDTTAPHTLNYQLRILGREGVLEMNFVASINQLVDVKASIPKVTALVTYDASKKYDDHQAGDKVAAYGLAGLIAVGAGAKIAAKVGLLALGLAFLKKGFVVVLFAAAAVFRPIANFFKKKPAKTPPDDLS